MSTKRDWIHAERVTTKEEANQARHDYAHEGWYTHIAEVAQTRRRTRTQWDVYVAWGRIRFPACCRPRKRTYIDEEPNFDVHVPPSMAPKRSRRYQRHELRKPRG